MSVCTAIDCEAPATIAWERWGTEEEVARYHASGDLPPHETTCKVMVFACDDHRLDPVELMSQTHDAECTAPPTCDCSVGS